MALMNVYTASGWKFFGVTDERDLRRRLREVGLYNPHITRIEYEKTPQMKYDLDTVHFPNRNELKVKIARSDPRVREELRRKAAELAKKYLAIAKSYDEDMRKYPKAAAGLKKSQEEYYRKARELKAFAEGKGDAPPWLAQMFVKDVTLSQLKRVGYDPTHPARLAKSVEKAKEFWLHPAPNPTVPKLIKNTGIKTVPRPQPKPTHVARKVTITSTTPKPQSATVHVSQEKRTDYRKLGMYAAGAVIALLILKKVLR